MTDYPYDFGNGYKIQTVFANKTDTGIYGDVYDFRAEAERAHPGAEIMTGYCVINEVLGLIPDGCNDWNDTIPEAIQDYEEHVVPYLEHEEIFELNCPVYDGDNLLYEVFYACKSEFLFELFEVDNRSELETLLKTSTSWDFEEALDEAEYSGIQINALVRDNVKVEWAAIGEGLHGDYDPMDPEDVELLRFYVSVLRDGIWEEKEDASYCTQFPVSATPQEKLAGLAILLDQFYDALSADIDVSVKKLGEIMSWIAPEHVANYIIPKENLEHSERMDEKTLQQLSNALTHLVFRNGLVEDLHSESAVLSDATMMKLNKDINNRIYSLMSVYFNGTHEEKDRLYELIGLTMQFHGRHWDPAQKIDFFNEEKTEMDKDCDSKSINSKIQSASTRAAKSYPTDKTPVKETTFEH